MAGLPRGRRHNLYLFVDYCDRDGEAILLFDIIIRPATVSDVRGPFSRSNSAIINTLIPPLPPLLF